MTEWKRVITGVAEALDELDLAHESNVIEVRDKLVAVFHADPAYDPAGIDDFNDAVRELEEAETVADLDWAFNAIYNWADDECVWIQPYAEKT